MAERTHVKLIVMNYFAHLVLSQPTVESTVGNLLGDFAQGLDRQHLSTAIVAGLKNHRAVDSFTDHYPAIQNLKTLFSKQRRRFAGIVLDVYFDHLLMKHWSSFDNRPLEAVIELFYARMNSGQVLMPNEPMRRTTKRMVDYDWFGSYRDIDAIGGALDRIATRIRFQNKFEGSIDEILANQKAIDEVFLDFYPALRKQINFLGIETGMT